MSDTDDEDERKRVLSNTQVLAFIGRFWLRRPVRLTGSLAFTLAAVGFDVAMPVAAGKVVDALAAGPGAAGGAWRAWAIFVGVYLTYVLVRNVAFRFWNPL